MENYSLRRGLMGLALLLVISGCGNTSTPGSTESSISMAVENPEILTADDADFSATTFDVDQDAMVNLRSEIGGASRPAHLKKGDTITLLNVVKNAHGGDVAQVMIDSDDETSDLDDKYYVSVDELKKLPVAQLDRDGSFDFAKSKKKKGKVWRCYKYVKARLMQMGLLKKRPKGISAWMASYELPQQGFRLTGRNQNSAILNDVCVYRGGQGGNGHIEIRVKGGWWYGYGVISHPINRKTHPFIGCYHKGA